MMIFYAVFKTIKDCTEGMFSLGHNVFASTKSKKKEPKGSLKIMSTTPIFLTQDKTNLTFKMVTNLNFDPTRSD